MKRLMIVFAAALLCACSGMNKNTISYQAGKYDPAAYYVVSGTGETKEAASANAMANMKQSFIRSVADVQIIEELDDLAANAKIEKVWKDKSSQTKRYFAIAVLKRQIAEQILQAPANELDARLGAYASQLQTNNDKFSGLRAAMSMENLIVKRNVLQDLYAFISQDRIGYETERFENYKKLYNDRLSAVKVAAVVRGDSHEELLSKIVSGINKMGLSAVGPEDKTALMSVEVQAKVDGYESEKVKGLEWAATSAAVNMRDLEDGTTFASFTLHDRAGTGRKADSVRKSMQAVGVKAADEIVLNLKKYLKTK
ncbi:MAG: hypothetical protein IKJ44_05435 [Elusimicrobiaceae bacterium]|nr:hypothetical protein [Elusimicrobiaceae bacterium]